MSVSEIQSCLIDPHRLHRAGIDRVLAALDVSEEIDNQDREGEQQAGDRWE